MSRDEVSERQVPAPKRPDYWSYVAGLYPSGTGSQQETLSRIVICSGWIGGQKERRK